MKPYAKAIAQLNRIADAELGGKRHRTMIKRHRHDWQTDQPIKATLDRGDAIRFSCAVPGCGKVKSIKR